MFPIGKVLPRSFPLCFATLSQSLISNLQYYYCTIGVLKILVLFCWTVHWSTRKEKARSVHVADIREYTIIHVSWKGIRLLSKRTCLACITAHAHICSKGLCPQL